MHGFSGVGIDRHCTRGALGQRSCELPVVQAHHHSPAAGVWHPCEGWQLAAGRELRVAAEPDDAGYLTRKGLSRKGGKYDFRFIAQGDTAYRRSG